MVEHKVATWTSTIKIFGKYTQICTNIIFSKDAIKAIENNKSLEQSLKDILHKAVKAIIKKETASVILDGIMGEVTNQLIKIDETKIVLYCPK